MDVTGTLVEFHLSSEGERALQEYVPGARFSAYALDVDPFGIWILTERGAEARGEKEWPTLLVKWDHIQMLRAVYAPPETEVRSLIGFRPRS